MKDIIILGGPDGAGKTTAAKVLLPKTRQRGTLIAEREHGAPLVVRARGRCSKR